MPSPSSNLYTVEVASTSKKKRSGFAATALALGAIAGAVGIETMLNPGVPLLGDPNSNSTDLAAPAATDPASTNTDPGPQASASAKETKTAKPVVKSATGATIDYRFGEVQVKVTKTDGKITAVKAVKASATDGRESAFSYLEQYAVDAQGTKFSNLSGATYTVDAFKKALDSALNKLG